MKDLRKVLARFNPEAFGKISLTTISTYLRKKEITFKKLSYFSPNKYTAQNYERYVNYVGWRAGVDRSRIKYFDESHIDRRLLGRTRGYGKGKVSATKYYTPGESYSLLLLTRLDAEVPIYFKIQSRGVNGHDYLLFWLDCIQNKVIRRGDIIVVDNLNIHVVGWAYENLMELFEFFGITYVLLPAYSPELNPAELVFNKLKMSISNVTSVESSVLPELIRACQKITVGNMINFYIKRGGL